MLDLEVNPKVGSVGVRFRTKRAATWFCHSGGHQQPLSPFIDV